MKSTFEFDQPYKQTESKLQETENVGMLRQVIHYKRKKQRWPKGNLSLTNSTNGTANCV